MTAKREDATNPTAKKVLRVNCTLRMPASLRARLATLAKEQNQSLNAWIAACLRKAR